MYSELIIFLIKASSKNATDNEVNVEVKGDSYYLIFEIRL
jgi:hypothetical protein